MRTNTGAEARAGFTLVEVLVTVLILGLLAAVVVPVVVPQIRRADPVRIVNDLGNLETGIELFQLDIKGNVVPGDMEDLANPITTSDEDLDGNAYVPSQISRWDGPYIDAIPTEVGAAGPDDDLITEDFEAILTTGFEAPVISDLFLYDTRETVVENTSAGGPNGTGENTGGNFVAIRIIGLTTDEFEVVNDRVDGETEPDGSTTGQSQQTGRLRFDPEPSATVTGIDLDDDGTTDVSLTYYLALPAR